MTSGTSGGPGTTVGEVRAELVEQLDGMCRRTGMYVRTAEAADVTCSTVQSILALVDGRREEWGSTLRRLREHDFAETGITSLFATEDRAGAEVVAWWAEIAAQLGWVTVRPLGRTDWDALLASALVREGAPWRAVDVAERLAPASFVVDRTVHCFAPPEPGGRWLYVDLDRRLGPPWRDPGTPVRRVRRPGAGRMGSRTVLVGA